MILRFYLLILLCGSQLLYAMPTNNVCSTATNLTIGNCQTFDISGAKPSNNPTPRLDCGNSFYPQSDIWFSINAPSSGNLTLEITEVAGGTTSMSMELYSGSCNNLTPIACGLNKLVGSYPLPLLELEGLDPYLYYLRVVNDGPYNSGAFNLCATDMGYSQFSCKIDLIIPSTQSTCDPISNTFNQDLIVTYRDDGSTNMLTTNFGDFTLTASPMTITLFNLPANDGFRSIRAALGRHPFEECYNQSSYNAQNAIIAANNCYGDNVTNDECIDAITMPVISNCQESVFSNIGATYANHFSCLVPTGIQDIWFSCIVPPSGEIIINTWRLGVMNPHYSVFEGSCGSLNHVICGSISDSPRISNRTPGETLFIKVMDSNAENQGIFGLCIIDPVPDTNEVCATSINIPVNTTCDNIVTFSNDLAASDSYPTVGVSCDVTGVNATQDLWYNMIVPASGILDINILKTNESDVFAPDVFIEIFEGNCSSLSLILCSLDDEFIPLVTNRTPGEVLYLRVVAQSIYVSKPYHICVKTINNDICQEATPIIISSECLPELMYSTQLAQASDFPTPNLSCSSSSESINDLWFSFQVPASGELIIKLSSMGDNFLQGELFESACTNLNSIECQSGTYLTEIEFNMAGRSPGEMLLLRVSSPLIYLDTTFSICATSDCPDTDDIHYPIDYQVHIEDHISIEADNVIENTADVIYDAGQYIVLGSGFEVQKLGKFHAYIDGCN